MSRLNWRGGGYFEWLLLRDWRLFCGLIWHYRSGSAVDFHAFGDQAAHDERLLCSAVGLERLVRKLQGDPSAQGILPPVHGTHTESVAGVIDQQVCWLSLELWLTLIVEDGAVYDFEDPHRVLGRDSFELPGLNHAKDVVQEVGVDAVQHRSDLGGVHDCVLLVAGVRRSGQQRAHTGNSKHDFQARGRGV